MFFFITFVNVVHWRNLRNRPKRKIHRVNRSKCADLVTTCIPVSWATTLIVTEATGDIDYYDNSGIDGTFTEVINNQWC